MKSLVAVFDASPNHSSDRGATLHSICKQESVCRFQPGHEQPNLRAPFFQLPWCIKVPAHPTKEHSPPSPGGHYKQCSSHLGPSHVLASIELQPFSRCPQKVCLRLRHHVGKDTCSAQTTCVPGVLSLARLKETLDPKVRGMANADTKRLHSHLRPGYENQKTDTATENGV